MTVPAAGMPKSVTIYEVGPRDGLQNEATVVPAAVKGEFIARLAAAGLEWIETTSFVSPRWVPQLADASEVLAGLGESGRSHTRPVLVPNERGMDRALESGVRSIAIFGSATETFPTTSSGGGSAVKAGCAGRTENTTHNSDSNAAKRTHAVPLCSGMCVMTVILSIYFIRSVEERQKFRVVLADRKRPDRQAVGVHDDFDDDLDARRRR